MAAQELFSHLPGSELVEENQAFRNDGSRFVPAPNWGLGATAGGRGMSMADLDNDGDLDIVVNNLMAPAVVFENQLCAGAGLEVDLRSPAGANTRGLGARLTLHTSAGTLTREVRSVAGYASGEPARVHFGFPGDSDLQRLDVRWPDGAVSSISQPKPGTLLTITRSQGGETTGATKSVAVTVAEAPLNAPVFSSAPTPTSTPYAPAMPTPQPSSPAPTTNEGAATADFDAAVPTAWFSLMYDLVRDEKLVPPLASRLFGYAGVALYEAVAPGIPGARSLAGQLNELQPLPQPDPQAEYYWPAVANAALATTLRTMLANTNGNTQRAIVDLERQLEGQFAAAVAPAVLQRSADQGQLIGLAIFDWAQADGFAHLNNCAYTAPSGTGLWAPTPPGFAAPLQPCWGQMRPFVLRERSDECQPKVQPTYSEDATSQFYFEALEVYRTTKNLTPQQQEIAALLVGRRGQDRHAARPQHRHLDPAHPRSGALAGARR